MESKLLNKYLVFYFITSQFIFTSKRSWWKCLRWLPLIVHIGIICVCLYILNIQKYMSLAKVGSVSELYTLITVLPNIFIIIANICTNKTMENILKMMINLHTDMEKQFDDTTNCVAFTRRHNFKVVLMMCIYISNTAIRIVFFGPILNERIDAAMNFMSFIRTTFLLHFLLHIDFVYSILEFLNLSIQKISNLSNLSDTQRFDTLNYVSFVHRKIWKSVKSIEDRFGWILLVLLWKLFLDLSNSIYWSFSFIDEGSFIYAIRK